MRPARTPIRRKRRLKSLTKHALQERTVRSGHARRYTRIWLLALLVFSGLLAAVTLFIEYRLESVRQMALEAAESRTGIGLDANSVAVAGLRGIRIDDLRVDLAPEGGPVANIRIPSVYIHIDIVGLLYGELNVERIELDHAVFHVRRLPGEAWYDPQKFPFNSHGAAPFASMGAFRVLGKQCTLQVENVVRDTTLAITNLDFDVYRLPETEQILANAAGLLNGLEENLLKANLLYASPADFDLKVEASRLTSADVNVFLPASKRVVQTGIARPKTRVVAYPDKTLMVSLEAAFENLTIRDHPPFLPPATGTLDILATYNAQSRELTLSSASAKSAQIGEGRLSGSVSFQDEIPSFTLALESSRLPLAEILDLAVMGRLQDYGKLDLQLAEPYEVSLSLDGNIEQFRIGAQANAAGGTLQFQPTDPRLPTMQMTLDDIEGAWDSQERIARAALTIADGTVTQKQYGVHAQNISGLVRLEDRSVQIQPLSFVFQDNAIVGGLTYNFADKTGSASINGAIAKLEDTRLVAIKDVTLSGSATVKASADFRPERTTAEFMAELTQAQVDYKWFFSKPAGLGVTLHGNAALKPGKEITLKGQVKAADTTLDAELNLARAGRKWSLKRSLTTADTADIATIAKCLRLPYKPHGSAIHKASYEWIRDKAEPNEWHALLEGHLDELHLLPDGLDTPHVMKDARLRLALTRGTPSTGELWLHAADASTPPFGVKWFNPVKCPPELIDRFPPVPRDWVFHLEADHLLAPPWEGNAFTGEAYTTDSRVGVRQFQARVGEGRVEGSYALARAENAYTTTFAWENILATPLLNHLKFPGVLEGTVDGNVTYAMDRDDPHTLAGDGRFTVSDGRFNADFLLAQFKGPLQESAGILPPSLQFNRLASNVSFQNDVVTTNGVELVAEGINVTGDGTYVTGGEMDYAIKLAIAPDTAERIPALRDNFTLQGYRLANRNLELDFRIKGPTLRPRSELASLPPPSITLVSGALETTSEVVQVFDLPRKILVDVFKIGAGIVGARKPSENNGE